MDEAPKANAEEFRKTFKLSLFFKFRKKLVVLFIAFSFSVLILYNIFLYTLSFQWHLCKN
jgi:hypothetical protein